MQGNLYKNYIIKRAPENNDYLRKILILLEHPLLKKNISVNGDGKKGASAVMPFHPRTKKICLKSYSTSQYAEKIQYRDFFSGQTKPHRV